MLESDKSQRRAHELLPRHTQLCLGTLIANNRTCDILADVEGKPGPARCWLWLTVNCKRMHHGAEKRQP